MDNVLKQHPMKQRNITRTIVLEFLKVVTITSHACCLQNLPRLEQRHLPLTIVLLVDFRQAVEAKGTGQTLRS